ncbi:YqhG family protein [Oceanobacillus saliphilus]|uniref:YqhG family protein n=1 Tax=Oceanobacillus saliphilus TaxID=2925834 RepID=UPI00201DE43C|nr:YqhG family protein [Oceanobacillus saliphilus]
MAITNLNSFLCSYFTAKKCRIIQNNDGILNIQLNEQMDRELMNRPFYWHYIKKIGREGDPMQLTLITNPDKRDIPGEWIHFGSPRLQQIMNNLKRNERFTKLFQKIETTNKTPLYPWLVTNIKISYQGQLKKDEIFSIGLQLVNGRMRTDMMEALNELELQTTISDFCFTLSPIIKLKSGYFRMEEVISNYVYSQDHDWAKSSLEILDEEIRTLKHFYTDDDDPKMKKEMDEITNRYNPCITMNVINGGIFYLEKDAL